MSTPRAQWSLQLAGRTFFPANGFTLVEMMIVLAISAIMVSMALPSFTGLIARNRLSSESSGLMADLMLARSEALRQGSLVTVCASADGQTCSNGANWASGRITFTDQGVAGTFDPATDRLLRVNRDFSTADSLTPTPALTSVSFLADGTINNAVTFAVCRTGYTGLNVSVSNAGRARMVTQTSVCP
jgi:type IV fimbrial biogenesis protein FimT